MRFSRRALRWTLGASLLLNFGLIAVIGVRYMRTYVPELPSSQASWFARPAADVFAEMPTVPQSRIFLGDSLTAQGPWGELFAGVLNRGVGGDTVQGVIHRLDEVMDRRPAAIFVMIGINDLAQGRDPKIVADSLKELLRIVRSKSAATRVVVSSVLPVREGPAGLPGVNIKVAELNRLYATATREARVTFVDLTQLVQDDTGSLRADLTFDGTHLTPKAYWLLGEALAPHVAGSTGSAP